MWNVEAFMRLCARDFESAFMFGIFLACREILETRKECFAGPFAEAEAKYKEQLEKQKAIKDVE